MANVVTIAVNANNNTQQGLQGAQNSVSSFGDRTKTLLAGAGAIGAGLLAEGLSSAMDLSAATSQLQSQLGLTDKEAEKAGKVAGSVFSDGFGGSLEDVTAAIGGVSSSIGKLGSFTDKQLAQMSKDALALAKTFDVDVNEATSAVGQMIKTGLVKDANEGFDIIAKGMQSIPAQMRDDILPTFQEYGTQFRKVGLDGKTAMGLLSQGLKAGARDADIVADSIKEFSIRAVDGSKTTSDGFKQLGLDGDDMAKKISKGGKTAADGLDTTLDALRRIKDPLERQKIAVELFGTQAEDMGAALYALDPSSAAAATGMDKAAGAAKKLTDKMQASPAQQMDSAMRTLKTTLGEALLPVVTKVAKFLSEHKDTIKELTPIIAGLVVVIGAWVAIQWALNFAMTANPIGLVVVAIAALAVGLIYAYKKSETFRTIVQDAFFMVQLAALELVSVSLTAFKNMTTAWMTVVGSLVHGAAVAFGWVPELGPKLKKADRAFGEMKKGVNDKLDQMIHKVGDWKKSAEVGFQERHLKVDISKWNSQLEAAKKKLKTVPKSRQAAVKADIAQLKRKIQEAKDRLNALNGKTATTYVVTNYTQQRNTGYSGNSATGGHAYGGVVGFAATGGARGNRVLVGERGPEFVDLAPGSMVHSNPDSRRMAAFGGGGRVVLEIHSGGSRLDDLLVEIIRKAIRVKGGNVQLALGQR